MTWAVAKENLFLAETGLEAFGFRYATGVLSVRVLVPSKQTLVHHRRRGLWASPGKLAGSARSLLRARQQRVEVLGSSSLRCFGSEPDIDGVHTSRPGRPPKRSLGVAIQENARLLPHGVPGLLSPGLISPTGLTAAAMAEAMKLQKMKLMAMNSLHGSGSQNGTESENEELNSNAGGSESSWDKDKLQSPITTGSQHSIGHPTLSGQSSLGSAHPLSPLQQNHLLTNRIDLPFMMMPHPLLPVSLPPASVAMAMNQMNHLNTIANMAAAAQMHSPLSRAGASVIKERIQDSPSPAPSLEDSQRPGSHASSHQSSSVSSSPSQLDNTPDRIAMLTNSREGELIDQETGTSLKKIQKEKGKITHCFPSQGVRPLLSSPCSDSWVLEKANMLAYAVIGERFILAVRTESTIQSERLEKKKR
nr:PREDICTED: dachshund homolog 2-like [Phalacrocorax carbo]